MVKHSGELSKMGQAKPLLQAVAGMLQVQTRSQMVGVVHKERDSEQDEREVGYSPRAEEAPSGAPIGKKRHKERLTTGKPALMFLKRAWTNSTKAKEGSLG
ncbi:hypothetical protein B296_00052460 [Ensete ventricosum]|uniref:Uncharacterized protein n=1 Tax=Ensete ventricosum TaxID=4639 RepID=A0A426XYA9_ENSVE|nr:hypothetical protein B296_00052460 [Ensete ventricosum]